jgi:hypothetical protein
MIRFVTYIEKEPTLTGSFYLLQKAGDKTAQVPQFRIVHRPNLISITEGKGKVGKIFCWRGSIKNFLMLAYCPYRLEKLCTFLSYVFLTLDIRN